MGQWKPENPPPPHPPTPGASPDASLMTPEEDGLVNKDTCDPALANKPYGETRKCVRESLLVFVEITRI